MKKLLLLMAACFVMVACGGEDKKEQKNSNPSEQQTKKEQTIEEKAKAYAQQYFEAADAQFHAYLGEDVEITVSAEDVLKEFATWVRTLDEEQIARAYEAVEAADKEFADAHDGMSYTFPEYNNLVYYL